MSEFEIGMHLARMTDRLTVLETKTEQIVEFLSKMPKADAAPKVEDAPRR